MSWLGAPVGRSLHSSFWVSNSKSLTLRRRSSRRACHRGDVVRHPPRQGLLVSDRPHGATKSESVAACDTSIFLLCFRVYEALPPTLDRRDLPAPHQAMDSTPRRLVGVLSSRI